MIDFATKAISDYVKQKGIQIKVLSRSTNISDNILYRSLNECVRPFRANEFLAICAFLEKSPSDFKKDILCRRLKAGELKNSRETG
jgi:DNA-binding Xre family transcriptional regulator